MDAETVAETVAERSRSRSRSMSRSCRQKEEQKFKFDNFSVSLPDLMNGFVYILKCSDNSYYTGSTKNLEKRLKEHNAGEGAKYTKSKLPVELIYYEEFSRIDHAYYREKQIQGWSRKKKQALMRGRIAELKSFSSCLNSTSHFDYLNKETS